MSESSKVSPSGEYESMYRDLYTNPHRNIALINAGIQKAAESENGVSGWHLLLNKYLLLVAKTKEIYRDNQTGEVRIRVSFEKLADWELKSMSTFALIIDEIATRVMSMSPITHQQHKELVGKFTLGNFSTSLNQIPGLDNTSDDEIPRRKTREPSVIEDYL